MGKGEEVFQNVFDVVWSTILGGVSGWFIGKMLGIEAGDNAVLLFVVPGAVIAFILAVRQ